MIARWCRRLNSDVRGAIAPLMILLFVFFGYWVIITLNTGQVVTDKTKVQNGADAAVLANADWMARYLNVMAMNNVGLAQSLVALVATASVTESLLDMSQRAAETAEEINLRRMEVCANLPPCHAYYFSRMEPAFRAMMATTTYMQRYRPTEGARAARATIQALNRMNDSLIESFSGRVGQSASPLLSINDIDDVFFYPPCGSGSAGCRGGGLEGTDLPVARGSRALALRELCDAADKGSDGQHRLNFDKLGYPRNKGPLSGGGSSSNPHVRDYISRETGLGLIYQDFWMNYPYPDPQLGTTIPPLFEEPQTLGSNAFTVTFDKNWSNACSNGAAMLSPFLGSILPTPYQLKGQSPLGGGGPSRFNSPPDFSALAVAGRRYRSRISVNLFESAMQTDYAYAQAWAFNPRSADLYTQDWQAALSPARYMDQPSAVLAQMQGRASATFNDLVQMMNRAGNANAFQKVNTH